MPPEPIRVYRPLAQEEFRVAISLHRVRSGASVVVVAVGGEQRASLAVAALGIIRPWPAQPLGLASDALRHSDPYEPGGIGSAVRCPINPRPLGSERYVPLPGGALPRSV